MLRGISWPGEHEGHRDWRLPAPSAQLTRSNPIFAVDIGRSAVVFCAPVEQVARHVLEPEAIRQMVKNAISYPRLTDALSIVCGRGVPTSR